MSDLRLAIAGTGKAANTLLSTFPHGKVTHLWGRTREAVTQLVATYGGTPIDDPTHFNDSDILILAVSDQAITEVSAHFKAFKGLVIHLSGTQGMDAIIQTRKAVMWPIQTLNGADTALTNVPLCVEASTEEEALIDTLNTWLGTRLIHTDLATRQKLHLCAVMSNNFTNFLMTMVDVIGGSGQSQLMLPMMEETLRRISHTPAEQLQTGPAVRGDHGTLESHIEMLSDLPEYEQLYTLMSQLIQQHHGKL